MAVKELSDGGPDGTRLGQSSTDKVGFFGATTVVKQTGAAAATNTTTTTSTTTALTTDLDSLRTLVNTIRTALVNLGLITSS
jgi:hypothetical protein